MEPAPVTPESHAPRPPVPWGIGDVLLALLAGFVGSVVSTGVWVGVSGSSEDSLGLLVAGLLGLWTGNLGAALLIVKRKGSGSPFADLGWEFEPADVLRGAAGGLLSTIVIIPILYAVLLALGALDDGQLDELSEPAERVAGMAEGPGFVVLFLFVGVGAPIVEELVFRGFIQPALVKATNVVIGVVLTAIVFGAVHFEALQFAALAAFGLVLGHLAHKYGRLGPCVVAHIVFNAITLIRLA